MSALEFAAIDEARAARFGGYLAVAHGCHVPRMTHEQAQSALRDARSYSGDPGGGRIGHCHRCDRDNVSIASGRAICRDCYNFSNRRSERVKRGAS